MTQAVPPGPVRSAAEAVRHALRQQIIEGSLVPGARLVDASVADQHGVSRNTARDALRLLEADRLVVSVRNVGYSVRELTVEDLRDLYTARRIIEAGAVTASVDAPAEALEAVEAAADRTEACVARGAWQQVGTASLDFHRRLVALAGSPSLDAFFTSIAAQLRLAFSVIHDEERFQLQWVERDRAIAELVLGGARAEAIGALDRYLTDSEASVVDAVRAARRARKPGRGPSSPGATAPDPDPAAPAADGGTDPQRSEEDTE